MGIYRIQNTSLSTYVGFTFVDIFTSVKVFDLQPSSYYYINANGAVTSPSPSIIVTYIDKERPVLEFSGCCSGESFAIAMGNENSGFLTIGDTLYFADIISSSNPNNELNGCFQLVNSGFTSTLPYYTIFSSENFRLGT